MRREQGQSIDKIEAVVNQEIILSSDVARLKREIISRYNKKGQTLPPENEFIKQVLDKLITDRLQLQIADRIGMRISDAQLDQTIQQIVADDGLTITQLVEKLENRGDSYEAYKDSIRNELTINEIRQIQVRRRINITDQEIQQMVERLSEQGEKTTQFRFAHIMLKAEKGADASEQREAVDDLADKIKQGANIQNLAIAYSEGPKATEGGDWGWRTEEEIPTLFADVFDTINTKKGDVIGPFRTNLGVHLIQVLDKKGDENVMTVEVKARHILIKSNIILSDDKAQSLLANYRKDILSGTKTFAKIAEENSQDPGSAVKGGDLGWADPNMYVPEFRDLSLSLPIGEISQPFRTAHGWHLLQVMDKRESDTTESATKQKAYGILFNQRFPAEVYAWMNEIRQEAYIKINNPDYVLDDE
ncbi:peptidylprolyl isomerase [Psychromonas sp. KJ10-10]|uniref:peptidylprolyl isomerase n=1 Tax=Psychromonas sp. KJ10-10 TaxID=3391823 RepID=UPI0039B4A219